MTHWNMVMVVPPLTITRDEVDEGVAILDDALAIADEYVDASAARRAPGRAGPCSGSRAPEEARDGRRGLVERVPEDGVPAGDDHDLEQLAERLAMAVDEVVVR